MIFQISLICVGVATLFSTVLVSIAWRRNTQQLKKLLRSVDGLSKRNSEYSDFGKREWFRDLDSLIDDVMFEETPKNGPH